MRGQRDCGERERERDAGERESGSKDLLGSNWLMLNCFNLTVILGISKL